MSIEEIPGPPATEVSPLETEVDPRPSDSCQPEAAGEERLTIGQTLSGRYRIERELGEGGMGVVYLAADEQVPGERFAIKLLKEELRPEALTLLREEVRKTRMLSHPNIVDVHSVNVDGQKLYVLMEYLEGKSLDRLLDEEFGRGMTFSHAWPIIEDVGAALGYAHDHNVIHSDLKPANVFVTNAGRTKLLDFGIARVSRGPLLNAHSGPRALTPAYASCEMLEGQEADQRDDTYSFACVIYEMLSGRRPFGDVDALAARERGARVQPLGVLTQGQNAALAQALAFNREGRTPSVEKLLEGLAAGKRPRARPIAVLGGAIIAALAALGLAYMVLDKPWISRHSLLVQSVAPDVQPVALPASGTAATFNPPAHSVAVLPFVNISGDKEQEYFSDGLTEELLNSLSRIDGLQVAARTSSFSFKGKDADIGTIARKLNVGAVLEGSVRRSGHTVRITAQLNNAVTGFHLWSQTYDRNIGDVLQLQTDIATAVAAVLKVTLLGDLGAKIELGGTRNPAAFDAYLRAMSVHLAGHNKERDMPDAIASYSEAVRLDPNYALAFAGRSLALSTRAEMLRGKTMREEMDKAQEDARKSITLAPELADGHLALAVFLKNSLDFAPAEQEFERALALAPGSARVLRVYGMFAASMGRADAAVAAIRRAAVLDPLNLKEVIARVLYDARRYDEALAAYQDAITRNPHSRYAYANRGMVYYAMGDFQSARSSCEIKPESEWSQRCLAMVYEKLGQHAEAESALAKFRASGDAEAYQYAQIYAQWGNTSKALEWLETALRLLDGGLEGMKTDMLLDPLRKEPRFQAIERELKFPH